MKAKHVLFLVVGLLLLLVLSLGVKPVGLFVDRMSFVNSQQYAESREQERKLLSSQIEQIEVRMSMAEDKNTLEGLNNQKMLLQAQLAATKE